MNYRCGVFLVKLLLISSVFEVRLLQPGPSVQVALSSICLIVHLRVLLVHFSYVVEETDHNNPAAGRAPLFLMYLEFNVTSKFIFLNFSCHKPFAVETFQVEPVETRVDSNEVGSLREAFSLFVLVKGEIFKTDGTSSPECVIILRQNLSNPFVGVKN